MDFPIYPKLLETLKGYNKKQLFSDINAGVIVGVVALPLSIAFAIASGVPPERGLITSVIAGFLVSLLGGSRVQIGGPTGAFVLILLGIITQYGIEGMIIASLMAGVIQILMGVFRFGAIFRYIPYPVVIGFNSGIALSIFTLQIKDALGLQLENLPSNFIGKWHQYLTHITSLNFWAVGVTVATILLILFLPKISFLRKIPSMLLSIVLVSLAGYAIRFFGVGEILTIGDHFQISPSLPSPAQFELNYETIETLIPSAFTIAIMGAIVTILSANISDGAIGDRHNTNTELFAQGVANIITPIMGGMPATGAIARTMTNISNGGRTPMAGITHAVTVLIIMVFLGGLTKHIPTAALAGMLIVISYNMADIRTIRSLLKNPRADVAVLMSTFALTVLFNLTIAIELGMLMAIILFLRRVTETSNVSVLRNELTLQEGTDIHTHDEKLSIAKGVEVYEIDGPFFFGIANKFDEQMRAIGDKPMVRVIRMRKVPFIDSTGIHNFEIFIHSSRQENIHLILSGVNPTVRGILKQVGIEQKIGEDNIFDNINQALEQANSMANQLKHKKEAHHTRHAAY